MSKLYKLYIIFILVLVKTSLLVSQTLPLNYFKSLYYIENNNLDSAYYYASTENTDIQYQLLLSDILLKSDKEIQSIAQLKQIFSAYPVETSLKLSIIYAKLGFAEESVHWLEEYFKYNNPLPYSELMKHVEFENINNSEEWRLFWQHNKYPKKLEQLYEIKYLLKTMKNDEAVFLLNKMPQSSRDYMKQYLLALAYYQQGDLKRSLQAVNASLLQRNNNIEALKLKYQICKEEKKYQLCKDILSLLLKYDRYNPEHVYNYAEINYLLKDNIEANKYITSYLSVFNDSQSALVLEIKILIAQQDYYSSLVKLNILINKCPWNKDYFILRADINSYYELWQLAYNDYSMVLDIYPFSSDIYYKMGLCQHKMNNNKKACYLWQKAASLSNNDAKRIYYQQCNE